MQVFPCFFIDFWAPPGVLFHGVGGRGGTPLNPAAGFHKKPLGLFVKGLVWFLKNNDNDKVLLILSKTPAAWHRRTPRNLHVAAQHRGAAIVVISPDGSLYQKYVVTDCFESLSDNA